MCGQEFHISVETSQEMNELFGALAKAQAIMEPVKKDLVNKHLRKSDGSFHRYSSLTACLDACKPLATNGISVVQVPVSQGNDLCLVTVLGHSSGQWMKGTLKVPELNQSDRQRKAVNTLQTMGVRLTYAKRYMLTSMIGLASDEDTDGEMGGEQEQSTNHNGDSKHKAVPPRPWKPETTKEMIWKKVELFGKSKDFIDGLEPVNEQMVDMLRKRLTDLYANDENIGPDDVNKIVPEFLKGCFGASTLAELKAPFGPGLLKYLSKKEDRKNCQDEILAFMKDK